MVSSSEDSTSVRRIDSVFESSFESQEATGRLNRDGLVRRLLPELPKLSPEDHREPGREVKSNAIVLLLLKSKDFTLTEIVNQCQSGRNVLIEILMEIFIDVYL